MVCPGCNYSESRKGRIWLGWKNDRVHVDAITVHAQFIHCIISTLDYSTQITVSFFYGLHNIHDRKDLWRDRVHGNVVTDYEVRDFKDFIDQMNFSEIKSPRTQTRIDRGLVNSEWLFQFPNVEAVYLPPSLSDHAPLLYEWMKIWSEGFQGNAMNRIWRKCKNLKVKLKELNTKAYGNVEMRVDLAQQAVLEVQNQMANDPHSDLLVQEATAIQQLKYWRFVQESIYRQKARVEWVKLEIVSFYKLLLGSSSSVLDAIDLNTMRAGKQLSAEAQNLLISPVVNSEIDCAIKSISDDKAPGTLHPQWNCTTLTLVPKIQNPSFIISKILTARLAQVVGDIVDEAQAGFIPGKHIGDNILLATELIK
ncbi:uncharacterized protein LOC110739160, partial [Chenopodium quinoa]|uniref:uncharacterized protein LOC110739160 n=1 Tax=Chenopodium quinoa TaxID=63459 RepID=UPI000B78ABA6